jgi:FtsZ-interacting cell division protein ZipA
MKKAGIIIIIIVVIAIIIFFLKRKKNDSTSEGPLEARADISKTDEKSPELNLEENPQTGEPAWKVGSSTAPEQKSITEVPKIVAAPVYNPPPRTSNPSQSFQTPPITPRASSTGSMVIPKGNITKPGNISALGSSKK